MATSGSVSTGKYDGRYYTLSWTATQDVNTNKSTVKWTLSCTGGDSSWYAERTLKLVIAGTTVYSKTARVERYAGTIKTGTVTISHDTNGDASFSVSLQVAVYYSTVNCTGSKTFTLTNIPRKSTLAVANGTLNTAQTLTVTRKSTSFTHTIVAKCGTASTTICTKSSSTSISFTPPIAWASQNTTGTSVSVTYTITTYNGSTSVGSNTYTKTCSIPASVKPSCSVAVSDAMGYVNTYGAYVKGLSKFKVTVTPTTSYGSAIASYSAKANGATYTTATFTTGVLASAGKLAVTATVKDKRGRTSSTATSGDLEVLDYSEPVISSLKVKRCDADGTENDRGEYVKVTFSASVTPLNNLNGATYELVYKKTSETDFSDPVAGASAFNGTYSVTNKEVIIPAESGSSYDIKLTVTDNFNATPRTTVASTAFTIIHWLANGLGIAFGKIAELTGVLDIGFQTRFMGGILQPVLADDTDLDTVTTPNTYTGNSATSHGYVNCPVTTTTSFVLEVMSTGDEGQLMQRITTCTKSYPIVYERFYYSGEWGEWLIMSAPYRVLYNSATGTTGEVTLAESAENFRMIEIIAGYSDIYASTSVKVYEPDGKTVDISSVVPSANVITAVRIRCVISGTTITQNYNDKSSVYLNATTAGSHSENAMYIKTVIGYR